MALQVSHSKHTKSENLFSLYTFWTAKWVTAFWSGKWSSEATSSEKWESQFPKRLPKEILQKFVLKEGSENSTDSLIELLSESGTSKEEYYSTFLLWMLLQSKNKYSPCNLSWSCCFNNPVKVLVNYGSIVQWFGSAIQILYFGRPASSNPLAPVRGT